MGTAFGSSVSAVGFCFIGSVFSANQILQDLIYWLSLANHILQVLILLALFGQSDSAGLDFIGSLWPIRFFTLASGCGVGTTGYCRLR